MKCAVYIRVSTDREEQKTSLKNQQEIFTRYINDKGWDLHKFYVDVESGTTDKRENLQNLISDAQNKKFDIIMAKELSRLARNGKLSYEIKDIAERNRLHILTLDNAINTLEGNGQMFGLYAWMYEQESQRISDRVKVAYLSDARRGHFRGSIAPYGYYIKDKKLYVRDDYTPGVVRRIFQEYLEGAGWDRIAKGLYDDGFPTPAQIAGKKNASDKWHGSTILLILSNPHYIGNLVHGRETTLSVTSKRRKLVPAAQQIVVADTHEPIISKEDFEAVQNQLATRVKNNTAPKKHLFSNVVYCAECGTGLWFKAHCKGYICGGNCRYGKKRCSNNFKTREKILENIILDDIRQKMELLNTVELVKKLDMKAQKHSKYVSKQLAELEKEIYQINERKKRLLTLFVDQTISEIIYHEGMADFQEKHSALTEKKQQLEESIQNQDYQKDFEKLKAQFMQFLKLEKLTPEILHRLVKRIEVAADGTPRIYYNFSAASAINQL